MRRRFACVERRACRRVLPGYHPLHTEILEQPAIEKSLTHLGLQVRALRADAGPAPEDAGIGCARTSQDRGNQQNV